MEDQVGKTDQEKPKQMSLGVIPDEVAAESDVFESIMSLDVDRLASVGIEKLKAYMEARAAALATIRSVAIASTDGNDWTLYRSRDGLKVIGCLRDSGATKVRPWYGISITRHRGVDGKMGVATRVTEQKTVHGEVIDVEVYEMLADATRGSQTIEVHSIVRSDEEFIGRANRKEEYGGPMRSDLRLVVRTRCDTKAVRSFSGLNKVPLDELVRNGIKEDDCHKGHGYGTSTERRGAQQAARTADEGVPALAEQLWTELNKRTAGSDVSPSELLKDITKVVADGKRKAFAGRTTHKSFTQEWQLKNAWTALRVHEIFGDKAMTEGGE